MPQIDFENVKANLEETLEMLQGELKNIRTGRANPSVVEDLQIDYFGTKTPLKQAASISAADARCLVITPWNKDHLVNIESAIRESDLNVNPSNDGSAIRIVFPALTEERRADLVKVMRKKVEESRIQVRKVREDAWDNIQQSEKSGEISEDDKFRQKDELQKIVDEFNERIEELAKKKEEEIMSV